MEVEGRREGQGRVEKSSDSFLFFFSCMLQMGKSLTNNVALLKPCPNRQKRAVPVQASTHWTVRCATLLLG